MTAISSFLEPLKRPLYWEFAFVVWLASALFAPTSKWFNNICYLLLLLPAFLILTRARLKSFIKQPPVIALLVFLIIAGLRAASESFLLPWKDGALIFLFYLATTNLPRFSPEKFWRISAYCLIVIFCYISIDAYLQNQAGSWRWGNRLSEHFGNIKNPIHITILAGGFLSLATVTSISTRRFYSTLLLHAVTLFLTLFVLQTRSIIPIWAVICISFLIFLHYEGLKVRITLKSSLALTVSTVLLWLSADEIWHLITVRSDSYRVETWLGYLNELRTNCNILLGCGFQHTFEYYALDGTRIKHPHNLFLTQFYTLGLVGLISFLAFVGSVVWQGIRRQPYVLAFLIASCTGLVFSGSFLISSPKPIWLFFHLPIAIIIASSVGFKSKEFFK